MLEGFFHAVKGRRRITRKCYTSFSFFSPKFCYAVRYFFPAFGQTVRVKKTGQGGHENHAVYLYSLWSKARGGLEHSRLFYMFFL